MDEAKLVLVIVEDDEDARLMYKIVLRDSFEITEATGGIGGVVQKIKENADVVILDYDLKFDGQAPYTGLDVMERLNQGSTNVPVVMISGQTKKEIRDRALELGVIEYIEKPVEDFDVLKQTLFEVIRQYANR